VSAGGVSAQQLAEIQARLNAATPGKWLYGRHGRIVVADNDSHETFVAIAEIRHPNGWARISDGEFISHAPADVAVLVEAVKALRAALEPFAEWARECSISATDDPADDETVNELYPVKTGDLRRAAAVLGTTQEKET